MKGHIRLPGQLGDLLLRHRCHEPLRFALLLLGLMAVRGLIDMLVSTVLGNHQQSMFGDMSDRFGDLLKMAMTYRPLMADVLHSGRYHDWPALFQHYLLNNDNSPEHMAELAGLTSAQVSAYHIAPLATLYYLGTARLIALIGPVAVVLAFILGHMGASLLLVRWFMRAMRAPLGLGLFAAAMMGLSYPVLFMLNRGNLAGVVMLLDFAYLLSLRSGRWRWAGWLALACAVNLRPEPALLALMEVLGDGSAARKFMRMVIPGLMTMVVALTAFALSHAILPDYTLEHMQQSLALYNRFYVQGPLGDPWNVSLQAFGKFAGRTLSWPPLVTALTAWLVLALGAAMLLCGLRLAALGRIGWNRWLFLLNALPMLLIPIHGYYHMVRFIPLVIWLMQDLARNRPSAGDSRLALLALTGLALSPLGTAVNQGMLVVLLLMMGCDVALFAGDDRRDTAPALPA